MEERGFSERLSLVGTDTTREDVLSDPVPPGEEWIVNNVALEDETSAVTSARLLVQGGVADEFYRQWTTLTAGVLYYENRLELRLRPGERVGVAFYGISASDTLRVFLRGRKRIVE